jgi:hypothetical protein
VDYVGINPWVCCPSLGRLYTPGLCETAAHPGPLLRDLRTGQGVRGGPRVYLLGRDLPPKCGNFEMSHQL